VALAGLGSACVIGGPPDGFFDEGEGGYSASEDSHAGGSEVVGEPTSTDGIIEETRGEADGLVDDGESGAGFEEALPEQPYRRP
jgi:hypothetical protein